MILSGDEFANTQFGNNNAYCQDNEISWLDWDQLQENKEPYILRQNPDRLPRRPSGTARPISTARQQRDRLPGALLPLHLALEPRPACRHTDLRRPLRRGPHQIRHARGHIYLRPDQCPLGGAHLRTPDHPGRPMVPGLQIRRIYFRRIYFQGSASEGGPLDLLPAAPLIRRDRSRS